MCYFNYSTWLSYWPKWLDVYLTKLNNLPDAILNGEWLIYLYIYIYIPSCRWCILISLMNLILQPCAFKLFAVEFCWALSLWLSISHATYFIQGDVTGEDKGQPWRGLVHLRVPLLVPLGSPVYLLKTHGPMTVLLQLTIDIDWWRVTGKLGILPWRFFLTSPF